MSDRRSRVFVPRVAWWGPVVHWVATPRTVSRRRGSSWWLTTSSRRNTIGRAGRPMGSPWCWPRWPQVVRGAGTLLERSVIESRPTVFAAGFDRAPLARASVARLSRRDGDEVPRPARAPLVVRSRPWRGTLGGAARTRLDPGVADGATAVRRRRCARGDNRSPGGPRSPATVMSPRRDPRTPTPIARRLRARCEGFLMRRARPVVVDARLR